MIDVVFYSTDKKEKAVIESWKVYLDHLNNNMNLEIMGSKERRALNWIIGEYG